MALVHTPAKVRSPPTIQAKICKFAGTASMLTSVSYIPIRVIENQLRAADPNVGEVQFDLARKVIKSPATSFIAATEIIGFKVSWPSDTSKCSLVVEPFLYIAIAPY